MSYITKFRPKDPGSAITHLIGWMMAVLAAFPLIVRAATEPDPVHVISLTIFILSMIALYAASTIYHSFDISSRVITPILNWFLTIVLAVL